MSSDAAELKKLVKQLQSSSSSEDIVSTLRSLRKDFKVNEAILRESKAGLAVGKLRTHASKAVADLAKDVVRQWKVEVEQAKAGAAASKPTLGVNTSVAKKPTPTTARPAAAATTPKTPVDSKTRTLKLDGVTANFTGDKTRDKCIELVYDALAVDSGAPVDLLLQRSKAIEAAVHSEPGISTQAYTTKMRSLFVNLKDKNNPSLREAVASGDIPVAKFVKMSSQEMASEERRKADQQIEQQNLFDALGAVEQEAETSAFQCSKCKQRKCRYRQAQTRSADEPMTTFVTCVNCNNRWKFS